MPGPGFDPLRVRVTRSASKDPSSDADDAIYGTHRLEASSAARASSRTSLSTIATNRPLPRGQLLVNGPAQRGQQIPPLGLLVRVETEPARQPIPILSSSGMLG